MNANGRAGGDRNGPAEEPPKCHCPPIPNDFSRRPVRACRLMAVFYVAAEIVLPLIFRFHAQPAAAAGPARLRALQCAKNACRFVADSSRCFRDDRRSRHGDFGAGAAWAAKIPDGIPRLQETARLPARADRRVAALSRTGRRHGRNGAASGTRPVRLAARRCSRLCSPARAASRRPVHDRAVFVFPAGVGRQFPAPDRRKSCRASAASGRPSTSRSRSKAIFRPIS